MPEHHWRFGGAQNLARRVTVIWAALTGWTVWASPALAAAANLKIPCGVEVAIAGGPTYAVSYWDAVNALWVPLVGPNGAGPENIQVLLPWAGLLIAGGEFTRIGDLAAPYIAQWDGAAWSSLGTGTNNVVMSLVEFNRKLIAGGSFDVAGGVEVNRVAQWDGVVWSALGVGFTSSVWALALYQGTLVAGGYFRVSGTEVTKRVAQWDGSEWQPMDRGFDGSESRVYDLTEYNGQLLAGCLFQVGDRQETIRQWDGKTWSAWSPPYPTQVFEFVVDADNILYIGANGGGSPGMSTAQWSPEANAWLPMGTGVDSVVSALATFNGTILAGGSMSIDRGYGIAQWDGAAWKGMGAGLPNQVYAITTMVAAC